jgi:hypothetical protein
MAVGRVTLKAARLIRDLIKQAEQVKLPAHMRGCGGLAAPKW